jgi:SNF2 family DNA or RNA helicase
VFNESAIPWIPHDYQQLGIDFLKEAGCGSLWLSPGLGKTSICLATQLEFMEHDDRPMLVIAPLRPAKEVWPRELRKWLNFNHLTYTVLHGPEKDYRFRHMMSRNVVIINYDGLPWLMKKLGDKRPFGTIVGDESTNIKSGLTQRFKNVSVLTNKTSRIWLLTGSPSAKSLQDHYNPQLIVDKGLTFGKYITKFRMTYYTNPAPYIWNLVPGGEEMIYNALSNSVLRLDAIDHLDMPELIENDVFVELPEDIRKVYDAMEDNCIAEVDSGQMSAVNAGVASMKLQQIANGGVYLDNEDPNVARITQHLHNEKTEAALEIVEDLDGKGVIIAYHYKHDLERLRKAFPKAPVLGSGLKEQELSNVIDGWNAGKHEVLLAHAQSAGHGLNLQEFGEAVIWYNITPSRELYDQLNARIWRQGQRAKTVVIHRIIAVDTVDQDRIAELKNRGMTQEELFQAMKARQALRNSN